MTPMRLLVLAIATTYLLLQTLRADAAPVPAAGSVLESDGTQSRVAPESRPVDGPLPPAASQATRPSVLSELTDKAVLSVALERVDKLTWRQVLGGVNADALARRSAEPPRQIADFTEGGVEMYAQGIGWYPFQRAGAEHLLFLYERAPVRDNECHACGVLVGAVVLARVGQEWRVEFSSKAVAEHVGNGASAEPFLALMRIGADRYAIRHEQPWMGQGHETLVLQLFELAPGLPLLVDELVAENNEGTCSTDPKEWGTLWQPCFSNTTEVAVLTNGASAVDDIVMTTHGTRPDPNERTKVVRADSQRRYVYRSGKYEQLTTGRVVPSAR